MNPVVVVETDEVMIDPVSTGWRALFKIRVLRGDEWVPFWEGEDKHNLRTNDGIDWQSGTMGGGPSTTSTNLTGAATASSSNSLTNSGATFPTTGGFGNSSTSPLAGRIAFCGPNSSGTGAVVWGVIQSNTATVLTVDRWYNPASPTGVAGSTPNATASYAIMGYAPLWWMSLTSTAITPAAADHTMTGELNANGFVRTVGAWSHTNGVATYSLAVTYTCTGSSTTINGEGLFNCQNGGILGFESVEPSPPTLISGDTLAETVAVSY